RPLLLTRWLRRRSLTSSVVANRAVSPARRFLPASRAFSSGCLPVKGGVMRRYGKPILDVAHREPAKVRGGHRRTLGRGLGPVTWPPLTPFSDARCERGSVDVVLPAALVSNRLEGRGCGSLRGHRVFEPSFLPVSDDGQ